MTYPDDNSRPPAGERSRIKSPAAWAVGGIFLLILLGALFFYDGRSIYSPPNPNTPNVVTGSNGSSSR